MKKCLGLLLATFWVMTGWAVTDTYEFPFDNPFVATVVGTPEELRAELPRRIPLKKRRITIFPDRVVPDVFWYDEQLRYSFALQRRPAPLVFLIAGTGGSHDGSKNQMMGKAFFQAGFHVVALTSPSHPNFIVSASSTHVPGNVYLDAEDLYRVMESIWAVLRDRAEVTDFYVTGYSLGGLNAGFVTWLDERRKVFNFRKALMINPPLRLYDSISLLDRMSDSIPGGEDNFNRFFDRLVKEFTETYKRTDGLELNEDFLFRAYETMQPKDEQLAALIGVSFRISSSNLVFTSDVMTDFGYIKPKGVVLTRNSRLAPYAMVSNRLGFTDFFHEFFYPFYRSKDPAVTREGLIDEMSLATIEDYLRTASKIEVMHNVDDIILAEGEIDFFPRVFGRRAKIYPRGGHCGNIEFRDNVAHMVDVFLR